VQESALVPERADRWIGRDHLLPLVLDAVSGAGSSRLSTASTATDEQRPEALLALLVFCYASGLRASEGVEQVAHKQGIARSLGLSPCPSAEDIQRFRRSHRFLIQERLAIVIEMAWRMGLWLAERNANGGTRPRVAPPDLASESAPSFSGLAERWIEQAILLDSVARDI
jgi:hypothetical protein